MNEAGVHDYWSFSPNDFWQRRDTLTAGQLYCGFVKDEGPVRHGAGQLMC